MRLLLTFLVSMAFLVSRAQTYLPMGSGLGVAPWLSVTPYTLSIDVNQTRHWQVQPFASVSAGYIFAGRGISYLSAPVGVMFYRPLSKNVSAFAGASIAPTVFNIGSLYANPLENSYNNGFGRPNLNLGVSGGLIYTNDAKTFSISGSISVEKGSYPIYAPAPAKAATTGRQY